MITTLNNYYAHGFYPILITYPMHVIIIYNSSIEDNSPIEKRYFRNKLKFI